VIEYKKITKEDNKNWMNVMNNMSKEEFMKLPYGFVKKYGSYIHFMNRI